MVEGHRVVGFRRQDQICEIRDEIIFQNRFENENFENFLESSNLVASKHCNCMHECTVSLIIDLFLIEKILRKN